MVTQPIAFEHFEEALRSKEEGVWCKGEVMRLYEQYILNAWEDKSSLDWQIYQLLWDDLLRNWDDERVQFKGRELILQIDLNFTYLSK
ncbi:hypothetical protein TVAGG3_0213350 [Trichomonas vaginalis G3]|uniref:uncharacterized protein n=2 Tax=Trichomonas vaginalis (strain ATCC PRA-98 / G3) TaxID=412133 RepID=UPI0021E5894C|nr:hypothetical protein TVAGG3_0213350 [Trichomonas vaginalis G3]XP_051076085.1 uncharacterized protein TVAGG3_1082590 [Trichomonas vaginalis G3]XP_051079440.1 hypothetical protein TVAGG3_0976640 [Trichomonas vaginalis G3]XP_051105483.1 hypothetical protein TVAGG3_0033070 [Trichomonas vaginalis G3]KAI5482638.1 hypothetical protein TVAGG3_1082590 [Trichomonas vaginalis G3]KAI5488983.1 hypothetical protein TVAGG3_0976640 [Trichomonas vaginalis G3]KAI5540214.1 hypothetical protein TVAGG3_0033070